MNIEVLTPTLANSSIRIHDIVPARETSVWDWHIHDECEFYMGMEGKKIFWVGGMEYCICKGDILFVNERVPHKTKTFVGAKGLLIQTGIKLQENAMNKYLFRYINHTGNDAVFFKAGCEINRQISTCLQEIIRENEHRSKAYAMFIKVSVAKIFAILYRNDILKDLQNYFHQENLSRVLPVLSYIDTHYAEPISLGQMSALLQIDKAHFCRLFKKTTNTTLMQYLNFIRVLKAEKFLLTTDKSMAEIAEETGFASPSYFTEVFRQNRGYPPTLYKKMKLLGK